MKKLRRAAELQCSLKFYLLGLVVPTSFWKVTSSCCRLPVAWPVARSFEFLILEWLLLMAASAFPSPFTSPVATRGCWLVLPSLVCVLAGVCQSSCAVVLLAEGFVTTTSETDGADDSRLL